MRARAAPGLVGLALLLAFAFLGPLMHRTSPTTLDLANPTAAPSTEHPLGTDEAGRDVLARLMHGGRVSLVVGVLAGLVALVVGLAVGGLASARAAWVRTVSSRLLDAAMAVPAFFVLLVILTLFGTGPVTLIAAVGATAWMGIARLVRVEALSLREREFVSAASALGAGPLRRFVRHLVPNLLPTLTVAATLGVAQAVLTESALSFLGLGIQPPRASWGNMLTGAQVSLARAPWLAVLPGICIVATVLACNAVGESVRRRSSPVRE
ncbi:MAG: ABC transporter permease [Gemmatimonadales bacterium]